MWMMINSPSGRSACWCCGSHDHLPICCGWCPQMLPCHRLPALLLPSRLPRSGNWTVQFNVSWQIKWSYDNNNALSPPCRTGCTNRGTPSKTQRLRGHQRTALPWNGPWQPSRSRSCLKKYRLISCPHISWVTLWIGNFIRCSRTK